MVRPPGHRGASLVLDDDGDGDNGADLVLDLDGDDGDNGADLVLDDDNGGVVAQPRPPTVLALCLKSSHEV